MSEKKFDVSLFLCCLMGGLLGFMASEALYRLVTGGLPLILQAGIYFAVTALLICLSGLLCEMVTGNLRGASWSGREIGLGLLMAVLFTLALGLAGGLFQFIYGLGYQNRTISNIQDYIVLIDNSGSTYETDPNEERYSSVVALAGNLDETHRMMVKIFEDEVTGTFPMTETTPQMQSQLSQFFEQYRRYDTMGGTDIEAALTSAAQEYVPEGRSAAVLLLSDGESDVDVNSVAQTYNALGIPIYCVGFSGNGFSGSQLLDLIANSTDGYYCEIDQLSNLSQTVNQMISLSNQRNLLERRRASDVAQILPMILRVVFITLLGVLTGVAIAMTVDSSALLRLPLLLHGLCGLGAGLIMEIGTRTPVPVWILRLLLCLLLSVTAVSFWKTAFDGSFTASGGSFYGNGSIPAADLKKKKQKPEDEKSLL